MLAAYFVNIGNLLILLYYYTTVVFKIVKAETIWLKQMT